MATSAKPMTLISEANKKKHAYLIKLPLRRKVGNDICKPNFADKRDLEA